MAKIPTKTSERISAGIKRFQPILVAAKSRDVGESDTVTIIVDMLAEIFGYDKYSEITSEHAIRGTFCDLATKIDGSLQMLIEVKAIGIDLKEPHVKQAVDYAANQGVDWVVLTNGINWRVYKVTFSKPISADLVVDIDFSTLGPKNAKDIDLLYLFCKEGWLKSILGEYHSQKLALSRYFLGAMILSDPVLQVIRRELKRLSPDLKVEVEEIKSVLSSEVLKREVLEGEKAEEAQKKANKAAAKVLRERAARKSVNEDASEVQSEESQEEPGPPESSEPSNAPNTSLAE
ncbi:MAG: type I restriction enzyme HsdR N-terminal domain-containing protein [Planctomyces sp.]|nr:type I restriction enzyme HsdR N-terminal domain-containing protein [Planctomyces sp.]